MLTTRDLIAGLRAQCANQVTHSDYCGCNLALRLEAMWELLSKYGPNYVTQPSLEDSIVIQMAECAERLGEDGALSHRIALESR